MKSVQIAIESLGKAQHGDAADMASHRKHAVRLVHVLEARVGEVRGDLLALEAQLDQAREMIAHFDAKLANGNPPSGLHPTMEWALRPFIRPLPHTP